MTYFFKRIGRGGGPMIWSGFNRDYLRMRGWKLWLIIAPRPELTPEGSLMHGWHASLWFDWVDCELRFERVRHA